MNYLELQNATVAGHPDVADFQRWLDAALAGRTQDAEVVVRLVDAAESAELNGRYRGKTGPTNVLSFPFEAPPGMELDLLGDLVICAPVVAAEAVAQGKPALHHWAHITVHGILHLLGYDHVEDAEAERMEALEIHILQQLDIANPYLEESEQ